jgi:hypothetical protein
MAVDGKNAFPSSRQDQWFDPLPPSILHTGVAPSAFLVRMRQQHIDNAKQRDHVIDHTVFIDERIVVALGFDYVRNAHTGLQH